MPRFLYTMLACLALGFLFRAGGQHTMAMSGTVSVKKHLADTDKLRLNNNFIAGNDLHHPQPHKGKLPHKTRAHVHVTKLIVQPGGISLSLRKVYLAKPPLGFVKTYPYSFFREIIPPPPKAC